MWTNLDTANSLRVTEVLDLPPQSHGYRWGPRKKREEGLLGRHDPTSCQHCHQQGCSQTELCGKLFVSLPVPGFAVVLLVQFHGLYDLRPHLNVLRLFFFHTCTVGVRDESAEGNSSRGFLGGTFIYKLISFNSGLITVD